MELTFFMPVHMVLCFVFVARTVLMPPQCGGYCWPVLAEPPGFLFPHPYGRGCSWDSWPKLTKGKFHTTSCSVIKTQGKMGERGLFVVMAFVFSSQLSEHQVPDFQGVSGQLPADGKWWMNSSFFLCLHMQLLLSLLNCHYLGPWVF